MKKLSIKELLLVGVTLVTFALTNLVPGDPVAASLGQRAAEDPAIVARFRAEDIHNDRFFVASETPGRSMFDLGGYIVHRLREAGAGTVEDLGLDTYSDEARFYSYRRATHRGEPDYGRLIAAIALA